MAATPQRPPALTLACVFVAVASGLTLASLVSVLTSWSTIETQESIRGALDDAVLKDLGVTVDTAVRWSRWALIALVPIAVSGVVFAIYAVRGHRASRWFLTVLCGLGFVVLGAGGLAGLLPAAMLMASGITLWSRDSRRWFDAVSGRTVTSAAPATPADPFSPPVRPDASAATSAAVTSSEPVAAPTPPLAPRPSGTGRGGRPRPLVVAAWTTIVSSAVVGVVSLGYVIMTTLGTDAVRRAVDDSATMTRLLRDSQLDLDTVIEVLRWGSVAVLALSLVGLAAGVLGLLGGPRAVLVLQLMAALTAVVSLLPLFLLFPLGIPSGIAAIVVLVQSSKPDVRTWARLS